MAFCDLFGMPSLFVTVTPDDSMSFRIKVFANSGKAVSLPCLDWSDQQCILDLKVREKISTTYPGLAVPTQLHTNRLASSHTYCQYASIGYVRNTPCQNRDTAAATQY